MGLCCVWLCVCVHTALQFSFFANGSALPAAGFDLLFLGLGVVWYLGVAVFLDARRHSPIAGGVIPRAYCLVQLCFHQTNTQPNAPRSPGRSGMHLTHGLNDCVAQTCVPRGT